MIKIKAKIKKKKDPKSTEILKSTTEEQVEKYHQDAKKNLEGITRVTRQELAKKVSGKDNGDSDSIRSIEGARKKDPSLVQRIKQMVKRW